MRSASTKKPLPRDSFSPRESKVSIATAEGLMRRTKSGRISCASIGRGIRRNSRIQTNFMSEQVLSTDSTDSPIRSAKSVDKQYVKSISPGQRSHNVPDFNILALLCAPLQRLGHPVSDFCADRDAIRKADQIRIFELPARALGAILKQHFQT